LITYSSVAPKLCSATTVTAIDSATSIENGAGDGVDWPLDERLGSIAEEQTKGTVVVDWQKSFL